MVATKHFLFQLHNQVTALLRCAVMCLRRWLAGCQVFGGGRIASTAFFRDLLHSRYEPLYAINGTGPYRLRYSISPVVAACVASVSGT